MSSPTRLPQPQSTRVLVVEDDEYMQTRILNILLAIGFVEPHVRFAASLSQAAAVAVNDIDLALVDLGLPDGNGNTFIEALSAARADIPILVISAWSTEAAIFEALQSGATGYLLKERDDMELRISIINVLNGGCPIDPFIARFIMQQNRKALAHNDVADDSKNGEKWGLTTREQQILEHVSQGMSNQEIADLLHLSRYTVETHIRHIYRKLSVSSRTKAVSKAREMGLL